MGLRLFGIAVADRHARRASRMRLFVRSLAGVLMTALTGGTLFLTFLDTLETRAWEAMEPWWGSSERWVIAALERAPFLIPALLLVLLVVLWAYRSPNRAPHANLAGAGIRRTRPWPPT